MVTQGGKVAAKPAKILHVQCHEFKVKKCEWVIKEVATRK